MRSSVSRNLHGLPSVSAMHKYVDSLKYGFLCSKKSCMLKTGYLDTLGYLLTTLGVASSVYLSL